MWQEVIATVLVVGAAAFLSRRFWWKKVARKTSAAGCSSCSGCGKGHCG